MYDVNICPDNIETMWPLKCNQIEVTKFKQDLQAEGLVDILGLLKSKNKDDNVEGTVIIDKGNIITKK